MNKLDVSYTPVGALLTPPWPAVAQGRPRWKKAAAVLLSAALLLGAGSLYRPDLPDAQVRAEYRLPQSRFIAVKGVPLHYVDEGQGPVVVLIHGSGASLHAWEGVARQLRSTNRVVRVDLPGSGLSGFDAGNDYSIDTYIGYLRAFLDALGIDRAVIAGHSVGGQVAWRYALQDPQRVRGLVLAASTGYPAPSPLVWRLAQVPVVGEVLSRLTPRFVVEENVREVFADQAQATPELVDRYHRLLLREGARDAMLSRMRSVAFDGHEQIGALRVPGLVLWGESDTWLPPAYGRRFAKEWQGTALVTYPDTGHNLIEERADAVAADMRGWLKRLPL
ncbi:alpha/beta fold hydrolase [Noviherbaspirillum denitrificans]|uniref:AB hydrolase-1 domain-containing protein n=1 Tax=Noviherbaspirillum denitrificans TaxID=1968433 RepID=A0A254TFT1_9BURK|nr:alpha/beta hydrolase [Noviherbaspirillum denitrificans]OWW21027.1 hypothetical protein AYR66_17645 [Noviherbaspirillum denitrificans]